ncbi:MAG: GntR family transcriptional regulator [Planctomycetota bacterium]|jgi:GntR family transcriptional regulator
MIIEIDPHGGVPIYRQVMDQIRRQIMTGQMAEGDQLESVKNLSSRLKVNPMTISKAYSFLVEEGVVERRRGVGLFVNQIRKDTKTRIKTGMLEEALKKAAALAVQMKVSKEKSVKLFAGHYKKFSSQKGRSTDV